MKIKNIIVTCLFSGLGLFCVIADASNEFQQWMQQQSQAVSEQKKEFQQYKDERDEEFTAFLKAHWKAVDIVEGELRDALPKPKVIPVAPLIAEPLTPDQEPVAVAMPISEPVIQLTPAPAVITQGQPLTIDFFGQALKFYYDPALKKKLSLNINKESVSDYWASLSRTEYDGLLQQLSEQKNSLQLNDWAYATLIHKVAFSVNNSHRNESALLSWFLLAKSGYGARIAFNNASIYLLVPSKHELFEVSYFTFGGIRYYAVEFDGEKQRPGQVYTYDGEYPQASKYFDMQVTPVVASNNKDERRQLSFEFEGNKYDVNVSYDRGRVKFFSTYPQLKLNLYFTAGVYQVTATPLQKQLAAHMQGMTEQQAVNFLLRFVQTSLRYETDEQQFGEENYLFPEETLFYPYSDCEDRAVLFAWLVKSLLKLDVVGLDYPGHVAAAVHFNEAVKGDDVYYQGKRYVITDPTYINANAGMTMPGLKRTELKVIAY